MRAVNGVGVSASSAADLATAIIFTEDPLVAGVSVKAVHLAQLRTAINAVRSLAGLAPAGVTDAAVAGISIKAVHVTELRTALIWRERPWRSPPAATPMPPSTGL